MSIPYVNQTDRALLNLLEQNDRNAFDVLYNRHWNNLFVNVVKAINDEDEAQDIVQDVFISLWLRRQELSHINSVADWLYGAVRKKALNYIRTNITRNKYLESLNLFLMEVTDSLNEKQAAEELALIIDREIDNLPTKMREVFLLSRKENLSYKEIAERLNISDKTVKKQINNVLKQFRLKLNDQSAGLIAVISLLTFKR